MMTTKKTSIERLAPFVVFLWWAVVLLLVLPLMGCEPKTTSPITGREVTAEEFIGEKLMEEKKAKEEAAEMFDKAKQLAIEAKHDYSVNAAAAEAKMSRAEWWAEQAGKSVATRLENLEKMEKAVNASIEAKTSMVTGALGLAANTASGFGPIGMLVGTALTGVAGLYGVRQKQRADSLSRNAERIVDSVDFLKGVSPAVKEAFKTHKAELEAWQGPDASALVAKLQA